MLQSCLKHLGSPRLDHLNALAATPLLGVGDHIANDGLFLGKCFAVRK